MLAAVNCETRLYLFDIDESRAVCVWKETTYPTRHGLAVGLKDRVWVTTTNAVVELYNWQPVNKYCCHAPGPLSVDRAGRLLVAHGYSDGLRDRLGYVDNGAICSAEYSNLLDVCSVQCLQDGTALVADNGVVYNQCTIKLVDVKHAVILREIESVCMMCPWTGVSVSAGPDGFVSISDVKERGLIVTSTVVSPSVTPCVFYPSATFLALWPEKRPLLHAVLACFLRLKTLPTELVLHVLFLAMV
ncbi:MAG: hypothetical protein CL678_15695 [Bdellovibrionaceae bacterium]|nr:hypothetical protein [Pseudobdellovibrionaceae bacterium]